MNFLEYIQGLLPVNSRTDLLNQIASIRDSYDDTLAPLIADIEEVFAGYTFKSKLMKDYDTQLRKTVNVSKSSFNVMIASLGNIRDNLDVITNEARALFSIQFTNENLTFNRATVLKYVDAVNFYVRYARKFLLYLVGAEVGLASGGKSMAMRWSPAETDWVQKNLQQFVNLFPAMVLTKQELKTRLNSASSAEIHEDTYELAVSSMGLVKTDPLQLDGFSPQSNPLMLLGKKIVEYRHAAFLVAKDEYYCLQLRLQEMREVLEETPASPVLQKRIKDYEREASDKEIDLIKLVEKILPNS